MSRESKLVKRWYEGLSMTIYYPPRGVGNYYSVALVKDGYVVRHQTGGSGLIELGVFSTPEAAEDCINEHFRRRDKL